MTIAGSHALAPLVWIEFVVYLEVIFNRKDAKRRDDRQELQQQRLMRFSGQTQLPFLASSPTSA